MVIYEINGIEKSGSGGGLRWFTGSSDLRVLVVYLMKRVVNEKCIFNYSKVRIRKQFQVIAATKVFLGLGTRGISAARSQPAACISKFGFCFF